MTAEEQRNLCQSVLLAHMLRTELATTYFLGVVRGLNERPQLNRHEIKRLYKRIEREFAQFETSLKSIMVNYTDTDDVFECMLDALLQFEKPIRQDLSPYTDAMEHIMLKRGIKEHRWIAELTTASHFIGLCAYIQGAEYRLCPFRAVRAMMELGGTIMEESTYNKVAERQTPPSVLGHLSQLAKRLLDAILLQMGISPDYEYESDDPGDPIIRTIDMHMESLIYTLQDYGVIRALFSKKDCTIEEANRLADEEDERINNQNKQQK